MVLASAPNDASVSLLGPAPEHLAFRVCGSEHDGFVLRLRSPKCTVGSDPTCTLRLRSDEVHPFHCLILRGAAGTFVRRWSADTTLNGAGFDLAPLQAGDRLRIGTVELEVLSEFMQEEVTPQPADEPSCLAQAEPTPDWQAEQTRLTEQTRELSLENERLRQVMESREEELRQAVFGHREQLELLRNELASVLAAGADQRTARAELTAKAEAAVAQIIALRNEVAQHRARLEQQEHDSAATRGQLETELIACRQQLAESQTRCVDIDRIALEESSRELAACRDMAANLRAELDQSRNEQTEQREMWRRDREQLELEFADSLATAQSREQRLEAELLAIRAEVELWQQQQQQQQQERQQELADAAVSSRPMVTEPMPVEPLSSTLALDPSELNATALAAAQYPDMQDDPDAPPVAEEVVSALESVSSENVVPYSGAKSGEEDENEIQRYMERLLRRVGNQPEKPEPSSVQQVEPRVEPIPVVATVADESVAQPPPVEQPKRRESMTAAAQGDLVAMRELAQRSTRLAITHSDRRTQVSAMVGEFCVAGICLVSGILAAAFSRNMLSVETIGGAFGISFGLVLMTRGVHRYTRLRKQSAGKSGHADL